MMTKDYLNSLAESMNFADIIPPEERNKLLKKKKTLKFLKGEHFLIAGEIPEYIAFVASGLLRLYYIDTDANEITKHFSSENTLAISYSAFLRREPSPFFIQAIEDSTLFVIDYAAYRELMQGSACWNEAARKLAELLFIIKEKREAELLLYGAQERYERFLSDFPNLAGRLSQYLIASYLNITPESLSRIRANMKMS